MVFFFFDKSELDMGHFWGEENKNRYLVLTLFFFNFIDAQGLKYQKECLLLFFLVSVKITSTLTFRPTRKMGFFKKRKKKHTRHLNFSPKIKYGLYKSHWCHP